MFTNVKVEDLDVHVKIVGWLSIVANAVFLLIGGFVLFLLVGIGAASGDSDAFGILSVVGTATGAFLAALGLPGIIAGAGLLARKGWGRILALIISAFGLLNFPIGTALGVYTFWVLLQNSADQYFSGPALGARQDAEPQTPSA